MTIDTDDAHTIIANALHRVAPEVDLTTVDARRPLQEELDLDSMDFLNLMVGIHEQSGLEIPERDYPLVSTLDGLVGYVAAHA